MVATAYIRATAGDPRRPLEARPFEREEVNTDDRSNDVALLVAMVLGALSLLLKLKLIAWAAVIAGVSAMANVSKHAGDPKTTMTTITFSIMGFIAAYLMQPNSKAAEGQK